MRAFQISALIETAVRDERERGIIRSRALEDAARQALEALKATHYAMIDAGLLDQDRLNKNFTAHEALRAALAEPVSKAQA